MKKYGLLFLYNIIFVMLIILPIRPFLSGEIDKYKLAGVLVILAIFDIEIVYQNIKAAKADNNKPAKKQNVTIALLRLVAAIGVLVIHISQSFDCTGYAYRIADIGRHGADIFMALSGYLIMFSLEKNDNWTNFFVKRFFKIVPVYYFMIILAMAYINATNTVLPPDSIGWPRYFFFISTLIPSNDSFWTNFAATWSVSSFIFFYLCCPVIKKFINTFKKSVIVTLILNLLSTIYWIGYFYYGTLVEYEFVPLIYIGYFMLGVTLYYAKKEHKEREYTVVIIAMAIFMAMVTEIWFYGMNSRYVWGLITVLIIMYGKDDLKLPESVKKWICTASNYSYSLYIIHPLLFFIAPLYEGYYRTTIMYAISAMLVLFGFVHLTYNLVEKPCSKAGDKLVAYRREKAAK